MICYVICYLLSESCEQRILSAPKQSKTQYNITLGTLFFPRLNLFCSPSAGSDSRCQETPTNFGNGFSCVEKKSSALPPRPKLSSSLCWKGPANVDHWSKTVKSNPERQKQTQTPRADRLTVLQSLNGHGHEH